MVPFRVIEPGVQPLAPLLPFRQMLEEEAAGDAAAGVEREPDQARNLLGLDEEMLGRLGQAAAFQRHDPLVALAGQSLIEGDRQIALAEQGEERGLARLLGEPLGIEADIAAQLAVPIIADEQVDDAALGLGLEGELAARILQRRAEQGGEHEGLAQRARDRGGIIVGGQYLAEHRPEPDQPPARVAGGEREADGIVQARRGGDRLLIGGSHGADVAINGRGSIPGRATCTLRIPGRSAPFAGAGNLDRPPGVAKPLLAPDDHRVRRQILRDDGPVVIAFDASLDVEKGFSQRPLVGQDMRHGLAHERKLIADERSGSRAGARLPGRVADRLQPGSNLMVDVEVELERQNRRMMELDPGGDPPLPPPPAEGQGEPLGDDATLADGVVMQFIGSARERVLEQSSLLADEIGHARAGLVGPGAGPEELPEGVEQLHGARPPR